MTATNSLREALRTGQFCYGPGTDNSRLVGTPAGGGFVYCYDPLSFDQGQHAYPYNFQFWAYDLNDWAAVKAGTKQPWEVKPYGVWPFTLPMPYGVRIGGVGYDAQHQLLHLAWYFESRR